MFWPQPCVTCLIKYKQPENRLSPIEWDNVILYGQYVLDRARVR